MEVTIRGRNVEVTDRLRAAAEEKVARLSRHHEGWEQAEVQFIEERNPRISAKEVCEATLRGHGRIIRAKAASAELKVPLEEMPGRLAQVLDERRRLERELSEAKKKLAMGGGGRAEGADGVRVVGDVKLLARVVEGIEIKDLKSLADEGKKQLGSGVVALVTTTADGKASIVVGVTPDLVARFSAVDLVRKASEVLGGKGGGGKPDMAQAGGPDGSKAEDALKAIEGALGG